MKLLYKLLRQNISILQTLVFLVVSLLGGVIVLLGIEAYHDFSSVSESKDDSLSSNTIVINKNLPADATISSILGIRPSFTDEEIKELESHPSIASVGKFIAARFEVGVAMSIHSSMLSQIIILQLLSTEVLAISSLGRTDN